MTADSDCSCKSISQLPACFQPMQPVRFQKQISGKILGKGKCSGHTSEAFAPSSNARLLAAAAATQNLRKHMSVHGLVQVCVALCPATSARVCRHTVMHASKDDCLCGMTAASHSL